MSFSRVGFFYKEVLFSIFFLFRKDVIVLGGLWGVGLVVYFGV